MRYLMMTTFSCVSMWMSEARRWMALKTTESTSLMIGEASCVIRSIVRVSSPSSSSETSCIRKSSVASSRTRCEDSLFWRRSPMSAAAADLDPQREPEVELELVEAHDVGRVGADDRHHAVGLALGHEGVAEHPLDGDRAEEVGVDAERGEVDVREAQPLGERDRLRLLLRAGGKPDFVRSVAWPWHFLPR